MSANKEIRKGRTDNRQRMTADKRKTRVVVPSIYVFIIITLISISISSCYEPVEGCLDPDAVNFDVAADDPCSDCCTYPSLSAKFIHKAGDAFLNADSVYISKVGKPYRIKDLKFYLSNFRLVDESGNAIGVQDRVELDILRNGAIELIELEDNFNVIERTSSTIKIGEFRESGKFDRLQFLIGVSSEANNADPNSLPEGHALRLEPDTLHWDQQAGYIFNKAIIQADTSSTAELIFEIGSIPNLVVVDLAFAKSIDRGVNTVIDIEINYLEWFKGIDFEASEAEIRQKIVDNTKNAFSLVD